MRIVILSDIHSNFVALEAVLNALPEHDKLWCLGDTIGYGPDPNLCLATIRERAEHALTGNHDLACLGTIPLSDFNSLARKANLWNNQQLEPELRDFLQALPPRLNVSPDITLAHGSPRDPIWEYILDPVAAIQNLAHFDTPVCCVGHSHVSLVFALPTDGRGEFRPPEENETVQLKAETRYIFNPGSVGQPRDGDPRAAYAILDDEAKTFSFHRVPYDIKETQRRMHAAGLPRMLADRLAYGH
jgi:diadenosine tetraphosphatase ApaH/serine/threonine PP2A family protein phosphatase